jgi:hypothetical protein
MIIKVGTETTRWAFPDENLANLVKRRTSRRDIVLQISTKADRGFLPQAAQAGGVSEVDHRIPCRDSFCLRPIGVGFT